MLAAISARAAPAFSSLFLRGSMAASVAWQFYPSTAHPRLRCCSLALLRQQFFAGLPASRSRFIPTRSPKEPKPRRWQKPTRPPSRRADRPHARRDLAGRRASLVLQSRRPHRRIDKHEKEINDFFTGIRFAADGKPKWQLPAGWKEDAGNAMRLATIVIPAEPSRSKSPSTRLLVGHAGRAC